MKLVDKVILFALIKDSKETKNQHSQTKDCKWNLMQTKNCSHGRNFQTNHQNKNIKCFDSKMQFSLLLDDLPFCRLLPRKYAMIYQWIHKIISLKFKKVSNHFFRASLLILPNSLRISINYRKDEIRRKEIAMKIFRICMSR